MSPGGKGNCRRRFALIGGLISFFGQNHPMNKVSGFSSALRFALFCAVLAMTTGSCNFLRSLTSDAPSASDSSVNKESSLRKNIADYARQYLGARYSYAGKSPQTGFDCSGFTHFVMSKFDISLSSSSRDQARQGRPKAIQEARPGDLIFFRRSPLEPVFHVALVVANDRKGIQVVHSTTSRGVVMDNISESSYWKPKIDSVRDVLGGR